jgi:hypothetical protein
LLRHLAPAPCASSRRLPVSPEASKSADTPTVALVIVDAENVRRSRWPNLSREQLVDRARDWAAREGHDLMIVFDGAPPEEAPDLVGSTHADDAIVELAASVDRPWWLVSSDRGLRERLADRPARIVGGGSFVRTI